MYYSWTRARDLPMINLFLFNIWKELLIAIMSSVFIICYCFAAKLLQQFCVFFLSLINSERKVFSRYIFVWNWTPVRFAWVDQRFWRRSRSVLISTSLSPQSDEGPGLQHWLLSKLSVTSVGRLEMIPRYSLALSTLMVCLLRRSLVKNERNQIPDSKLVSPVSIVFQEM